MSISRAKAADAAKLLSYDEARRIAVNIAKLRWIGNSHKREFPT
jgi:hypothetical protein